MKIAVCVSGIPRSGVGSSEEQNQNLGRNFNQLQKNFPSADFYLGTWKPYEDIIKREFPNQQYWLFDEPNAHYHPWLDAPPISDKLRKFEKIFRSRPELHERTRHQAKQIICHANMVNNLPREYDVIVRVRFDTFTSSKARFDDYVQAAYNNKTAIGFACLKQHWPTFNSSVELTKTDDNRDKFLFDSLIIHSSDCIDTANISELYKQGMLCPAEFGWYQVLSQPYNDNHRCISGWANADRCVLKQFLKEV